MSLPYHNPLWVADRAILLDHLTRGRFMLGIGPGILATDAHMVGLDPAELRNYLQEDFPVLMHLLRSDEPISIDTGRYELVDARCQLDRYSDFDVAVASIFTPSGPLLAGRYGIGLLQLSGLTPEGMAVLPKHWEVVEKTAAEYGTTVAEEDWRVVGIMHLAETRDRAIDDVRFGINEYFDYIQHTIGGKGYAAAGSTFDDRLEWAMSTGNALVGTPADAIAKLEELVDASGGRVGRVLVLGAGVGIARGDATLVRAVRPARHADVPRNDEPNANVARDTRGGVRRAHCAANRRRHQVHRRAHGPRARVRLSVGAGSTRTRRTWETPPASARPLRPRRVRGCLDPFAAMLGMAEVLAIPRSQPAAAEAPFGAGAVAHPFIRVEVGECFVEPVLGLEHMMARLAVHDAVRMRVVVEVDHVVRDEVHRAVKVPQ